MGDGALAEAKKRGHDKKPGIDLTLTKASYNPSAMITGDGDYSGTVLDGLVVDGYTRNTYRPNGDLKTDVGPVGTPLISLMKPGCKVLNCTVVNSAGPGVQMLAGGTKDKPETWNEISNSVIVNTLMEAIDFRVGNWDPDNNPDGGYAAIKNNTVAFVWSWNGEGYSILIGRQTKLTIENNILAFATDYSLNNGFGNDKAKLIGNAFFNNMGGVYRYFAAAGSKSTVVVDDPALLEGKAANKSYYLSDKSKGNITADPKVKPDPAFFDKFTNQIKSEGGGKVVWDEVNQWRSMMGLPLIGTNGTGAKNYAPIYEHDFIGLFSSALTQGARSDAGFAAYTSKSASVEKDYTEIAYADLGKNLGKDVKFKARFNSSPETSGWYIDGVASDKYVIYRTKDMQNFIYIPKGSEALEMIQKASRENAELILSGTLYDIKDKIKMSNKYGFVCDSAESDE
jgi:hypothetical protein